MARSLTELRGLVKRDPTGFTSEYEEQMNHFKSIYDILQTSGTVGNNRQQKEFIELVDFLSHCAKLFADQAKEFPGEIRKLLLEHGTKLEPWVRTGLVKSLILMRNRDFIKPMFLFPAFFQLFVINDKSLRKLIFFHIVNDLARINKHKQNMKLNRKLQNYIFSLLKNESALVVRKSLGVICELFRKKIWIDVKTVNVVAEMCFCKHSQVCRNALRFFMGDALPVMMEENLNQKMAKQIKVNTKRKRKRMIKLAKTQQKLEERAEMEDVVDDHDLRAIRSIDDPQTLAERLFSALKKSKEAWDIRLLYVGVISRIIAHHQVMLFNFYPWIQNYCSPAQRDVTKLLAYLAQSVHRLVPPEVLEPVVKYLADRFVGDRSSVEAVGAGINAIRAICARQPLAMNGDLLQDLTMYKTHSNKGIKMAARSLIHLYRLENPDLLAKKDQGKWKDFAYRYNFGDQNISDTIKGLELLAEERGLTHLTPQELMSEMILDDDDIERIRELRIDALANKYGVSHDRIVLNDDGEVGQEMTAEDIKSATQIKREAKAAQAELKAKAPGKKHWTEYMTEIAGTGTNKDKERTKDFQMMKKKNSVLGKRKRTTRDTERLERKLKKRKKEQNRHKRKFRKN